MVDQGNFALEKHVGGSWNPSPVSSGYHPLDNVLDSFYEVYGREYILAIADTKPKDKDQILLKDLDLNISFKVNPALASKFITERAFDLTYDSEKGSYILGMKVLDKEVRSMLNSVTQKFSSDEILIDQNKFETAVKESLSKQLEQNYGKLFEITDVRISNVLVAESVEAKKQAIELVKAEQQKNDATQNILKSKKDTLVKEMQVYADAAKETGVPLDIIVALEQTKALREMNVSAINVNMDVKAPKTPSPKP